MGRPPNEPDPGAGPLELFAYEHRRYRKAAGISQADLAAAIVFTPPVRGHGRGRRPHPELAVRGKRGPGARRERRTETRAGGRFYDLPGDVSEFIRVYDHLRATALSPPQSRKLIASLLE